MRYKASQRMGKELRSRAGKKEGVDYIYSLFPCFFGTLSVPFWYTSEPVRERISVGKGNPRPHQNKRRAERNRRKLVSL